MRFVISRAAIVIAIIFVVLPFSASAQTSPRVVHIFVALCDNQYQGIVPVPATLGNGDDPRNNLYWGALYGVKTFFKRSSNWDLVQTTKPTSPLLERCIFKHRRENVYLVADAYRGRKIKRAVIDYLNAASGQPKAPLSIETENDTVEIPFHGDSNLIVYVGHNGLMDFRLKSYPAKHDDGNRETMILACKSKTYFRDAIVASGAKPLLWTTGLMAPEAYTLENAIEGWIAKEDDEAIRLRAAKAYDQYQKCGLRAASRLLVSGF